MATPSCRHRATKPWWIRPSFFLTPIIAVGLFFAVLVGTGGFHSSSGGGSDAASSVTTTAAQRPDARSIPRDSGPTSNRPAGTTKKSRPRVSATPDNSAKQPAKPSVNTKKTQTVPTAEAATTPVPPASDLPTSVDPAAAQGIPDAGLGGVETAVVQLVNEERAKAGCGPVTGNTMLSTAARMHSQDMASRGYFDHTSQDGREFSDRIKEAGYAGSTVGENIAAGQPDPQAVMQSWMNSEGHRANILDCSFKDLGVGMASGGSYGIYWTQDFGG